MKSFDTQVRALPLFVLAVGIWLAPLLWVVYGALSSDVVGGIPTWKEGIHLKNFYEVFDLRMISSIGVSFVVSFFTAVICAATALLVSYFLLARKRPSTGIISDLACLKLLPPVAFLVPQIVLAKELGVTPTVSLFVLSIVSNLALSILLLAPFVLKLERQFGDQARLDCAGSDWPYFSEVIVPQVRQPTLIAFVVSFMATWTDFLLPSLLFSSSKSAPLTTYMGTFLTSYETLWGSFYATVCISILLGVMFSVVFTVTAHGITDSMKRRQI